MVFASLWRSGVGWAAPLLLCIGAGPLGCQKTDPAPAAEPGDLRIVSLSPALSRTLCDFDLEDRIVGRTMFCSSLDQSIPVVGRLYYVNYERLIKLRPTHVLVQPPAAGIDPRLQQEARARGWAIAQWRLDSLQDVRRTIRELPGSLFVAPDPDTAATRRAEKLLAELTEALARGGEDLWRGPTLLVASADPVLVFGRGTFLDEMLEAIGGRNAVALDGWQELSLEDVLRLDPEAMIIVRDSGPPDVAPREAAGGLGRLDIAAVRHGRVAVLWHLDANSPSSGLIGVARTMRRVLRELAEAGTGRSTGIEIQGAGLR